MIEMPCPWCAAELRVAFDRQTDEQTCPECLTRWSYEDAPAEAELAIAA